LSHAAEAGKVAVELAQLPTEVTKVADAMDALDETIHQKVRLGIMSTLLALGEADFKLLKETLGLSDGNLSTHLSLLEERGYVEVRKEFRGKRPHTSAVPTESGRRAFAEYLAALERIIKAAQP
jgi:DNA-binding transcriptional ArsR family regulator